MKICILFNHFQISDGVTRSAIGIANALAQREDVEVTLRPLFRFDRKICENVNPRVVIKPIFRGYFKGLSRMIGKLPMRMLHKIILGNEYDVEVGLCMSLPIRIVAAYPKESNGIRKARTIRHFAWMHCYDEKLTLRQAYYRMDKVICVSQYNAKRLREEASGYFAVDYCYNLIDDEAIRAKGDEQIELIPSPNLQFVSVGRLSQEKGYKRLLYCVKRLKDEGYSFGLWIIGDGPQKNELNVIIKELELEDTVILLGEQINPHSYTAKADVFVCSSFNEGYSTACTEAIMLGIPVLTTNVSGGEEIIEESGVGKLVGMDDEALYQGMKEIVDNPSIINIWKRKLLETRGRFSYSNRMYKLYDIFGIKKIRENLYIK